MNKKINWRVVNNVVIVATLFLHMVFSINKTYSIDTNFYSAQGLSKEQYNKYIAGIPTDNCTVGSRRVDAIEATTTTYFGILPAWISLFFWGIYGFYALMATAGWTIIFQRIKKEEK